MDWEKIEKELKKPFPKKDIQWRFSRTGKRNGKYWGKMLAYITSRAIQDRLDEVIGQNNWQFKVRDTDNGFIGRIEIWDENRKAWIYKEDGSDATQFEAFKGGISGAFKRAAVLWGIGRYLYHLKESWADINKNGDEYGKITYKENGKKYETYLNYDVPKLPQWALPSNTRKPKKKQEQVEKGKQANKDKQKEPDKLTKMKRKLWNKFKDFGYDKQEVRLILTEAFDSTDISYQDAERAYKDFDELRCKTLLRKAIINSKEELKGD